MQILLLNIQREGVWITLCDSKRAHYNESRVTHCRQTLICRTHYAYEYYRRIDRASRRVASRAMLKIEIVTGSNIAIVARTSRKSLSSSLPLSFIERHGTHVNSRSFPRSCNCSCAGWNGGGARSRRVHLRIAQSSRKLQSEIFCRRRRRRRRRPTHDVPADTGARRAEWDGAHAMQLQLGQRAIVLREVV